MLIAAQLHPTSDGRRVNSPSATALGQLGGLEVAGPDRAHDGLRTELHPLRHLRDRKYLETREVVGVNMLNAIAEHVLNRTASAGHETRSWRKRL
jgi:hypothetical protein